MKNDKRWLPNKQECEKVGAIDLQLFQTRCGLFSVLALRER